MKKVIVVDDDIVMFRLFQVQVKRTGCEGFFFRDAQSVLKQFESIQPDLVVLDYNLPDMDGSALYQNIRKLKGGMNIPIVFVTGTAKDEDLEAIRAVGANTLLSKPFSPRRLQNLIKELLELE
ncbi:MAG: CheY-like chemotaxis protein [Lentimonas sp.]|jgi:CheY-like chemotaxis protein